MCRCKTPHEGKTPCQAGIQPMIVEDPWGGLGSILWGPIRSRGGGKHHLLMVMDHFSKWTDVYAIVYHTASTVDRLFCDQLFVALACRFSCSVTKGQSLKAAYLVSCLWMGINKMRSTAYKPSTND